MLFSGSGDRLRTGVKEIIRSVTAKEKSIETYQAVMFVKQHQILVTDKL
jgi:hypothetical protein